MESLTTRIQPRRGRPAPPADSHGKAPSRPITLGRREGVEGGFPSAGSLVLDRYRLLECLGAGGFGVVWSAHDELLHREVAVKRIAIAPDGDSERATREALASARLAHPAIVALYEACAVDDAFYLISELVGGRTLAQLIAERSLADEEIVQIGLALTGALEHAHSRGVIHRDVKPQNVLVPDRHPDDATPAAAVAKLTDFGGASLAGEDVLTRTGDVLGTLAYMAPEQSEGREAREPADLYSLALVLVRGLQRQQSRPRCNAGRDRAPNRLATGAARASPAGSPPPADARPRQRPGTLPGCSWHARGAGRRARGRPRAGACGSPAPRAAATAPECRARARSRRGRTCPRGCIAWIGPPAVRRPPARVPARAPPPAKPPMSLGRDAFRRRARHG